MVHHELGYDLDDGDSVCPPTDECHLPGRVVRGYCTNPARDWHTPCDDQDPNTVQDSCQAGVCTGVVVPNEVASTPSMRESIYFAPTRDHGAGYLPATGEYVFPQWSCCAIYRHDRNGLYTGRLPLSQSEIMQMWAEPSGDVYTANWGQRTCSRFGPYPETDKVWQSDISATAGGVASDGKYVYCAESASLRVHRLNKTTGQRVDTLTLTGGSESGTLYGGLAIIRGHLYRGTGSQVLRYNATDGRFDGYKFEVDQTIHKMVFNGKDICVGTNSRSNELHCYPLFPRNLYDIVDPELLTDIRETGAVSHPSPLSQTRDCAGFHPALDEIWVPSRSSLVVDRMTAVTDNSYGNRGRGTFVIPGVYSKPVRQLWPDREGNYYVATGATVVKVLFPEQSVAWTYSAPDQVGDVGGVTATHDEVIVMPSVGALGYVLNASDGTLLRSLQLQFPAGFTPSLDGALVAGLGFLFYGDASSRTVHVFDKAGLTGAPSFAVSGSGRLRGVYFDGKQACFMYSTSWGDTRCYQLFNANVYETPASATPNVVPESTLLSPAEATSLSDALGRRFTYKLCYRASRDGWSSSTFHSRCDNLGPTVTLGRVGTEQGIAGSRFGGFASRSWQPNANYMVAPGSWLFRIVDETVERSRSVTNWNNAMYSRSTYCPTFGGGHDLYLDSTCRSGSSNKNSYELPGGSNWLAGTSSFRLDELEVFYRAGPLDLCKDVICEPLDQCHVAGVCQAGTCSHPLAQEGTLCDDRDNETILDRCRADGVCAGDATYTSEPSLSVSGLQPYQLYAFFVAAYTNAGIGEWGDPRFVRVGEGRPQGPPTLVRVAVVGVGEALLSWQPPLPAEANGECAGYDVQLRRSDASNAIFGNVSDPYRSVASGRFQQFSATGLDHDIEYEFRVRCYTSVGTGPFSEPVAATTPEFAPEGSPRELALSWDESYMTPEADGAALVVSWAPPAAAAANGVITAYHIMLRPFGDHGWVYPAFDGAFHNMTVGNVTQLVISPLKKWVGYEVKIAAANAIGAGPYSSLSQLAALDGFPTGTPSNLSLTLPPAEAHLYPPAADTLIVHFSPPPHMWFNNTPLVRYVVMYQRSSSVDDIFGADAMHEVTAPVPEWRADDNGVISVTLTNLTIGAPYHVQVQAVANGIGQPSSKVTRATRDSTPGAPPPGITLTPVNSSAIRLNWQAVPPAQRNGRLIGYEVAFGKNTIPACVKTCPPPDACHEEGVCDAETGECVRPPLADFTPCGDGNATTANDVCLAGRCVGTFSGGTPPHRQLPLTGARRVNVYTRSYGAGYFPATDEFWFPSWSGSTIYRTDLFGVSQGSFTAAGQQRNIQHLWGTMDGFYYTANSNEKSCSKLGPYPNGDRLWSSNIGLQASAVSVHGNTVYCAEGGSSLSIHLLNASDGREVGQLQLTGKSGVRIDNGQMAVVEGKVYVMNNRELHRFNASSGEYDGQTWLMGHSSSSGLMFDGQSICTAESSSVYCYKVLENNIYKPQSLATLLETPRLVRTASLRTNSYGGGYSPRYKEYWYPDWSGYTIGRSDRQANVIGSFRTPNYERRITSLWGNVDGSFFFASDRKVHRAKFDVDRSTAMWTSADFDENPQAVSAEGGEVFVMMQQGPTVHALDAETGALRRTFQLQHPEDIFRDLRDGMMVAQGKLFYVRQSLCYRFDVATGLFDNATFPLQDATTYGSAFDGRDFCLHRDNTVRCYQLFSHNIYDAPSVGKPQLVVGSKILTNEDNEQLSDEMGGRMSYLLCYSGLEHGFGAAEFHERCENKGHTLTVLSATINNQPVVFGGYTDVPWTQRSLSYRSSSNSWLFRRYQDVIQTTDHRFISSAVYDRTT